MPSLSSRIDTSLQPGMNKPMSNQKTLDQIIKEIIDLKIPKIDEARSDQIRDFIETTVNGDVAKSHLVLSATLSENKKGILTYILTNKRVIKIDIGEQDLKSSSYPLDTIIGIERKLLDGDKAEVLATFQSGSFGLRHSPKKREIVDFFQSLELLGSKSD